MDFDALEAQLMALRDSGRFAEALSAIDQHASALPEDSATIMFWRARLLARSGAGPKAVGELERMADAGHWRRAAALDAEEDLATLQDEPAFAKVVRAFDDLEGRACRAGPPHPLVLEPKDADRETPRLVAFHPAGSSPARFAHRWAPAASAGWGIVLPHASNCVASDSALWLDRKHEALDGEAAARALGDALAAAGSAEDAAEDRRSSSPVVLAGFGDGGAVALLLALRGEAPHARVLLVGGSARHLEAVEAASGASARPLRIHALVGQEDPHVDLTRETARRLRERGADASLEVRAGLGQVLPPSVDAELPGLLDELAPR